MRIVIRLFQFKNANVQRYQRNRVKERIDMRKWQFVLGMVTVSLLGSSAALAQGDQKKGDQKKGPPPPMSFFVTSVGSGKGANLGGLAGADAHCQELAAAGGAGDRPRPTDTRAHAP